MYRGPLLLDCISRNLLYTHITIPSPKITPQVERGKKTLGKKVPDQISEHTFVNLICERFCDLLPVAEVAIYEIHCYGLHVEVYMHAVNSH